MKIQLFNFKKPSLKKQILFILLGILFIFAIWFILSSVIKNGLFPSPIDTFARFFSILGESITYLSLGWTLLRLLIALIICFILSFVLGLFGGLNDSFNQFLKPIMIVLRTLPVVTIVYLLVVSVPNMVSLIIILSLVMLPIMYETTKHGFKTITPDEVDVIRVYGDVLSRESLKRVIIPIASESIVVGVVQSAGLGMKVAIMSEVLVGNNTFYGLGRLINGSYLEVKMVDVFAYSLLAIIVIGIIDFGFRKLSKRYRK